MTTWSGFGWGSRQPLHEPPHSTPLDDGQPAGATPRAVTWAMKYHRHLQFGHDGGGDTEHVLGEGDGTVYALGDGVKWYMVGRLVGESPDGSVYCLVASIDAEDFGFYASGVTPATAVFSATKHPTLCAVYEGRDGPSNVTDVYHYRRGRDIPEEYLPPSPYVRFDSPLG